MTIEEYTTVMAELEGHLAAVKNLQDKLFNEDMGAHGYPLKITVPPAWVSGTVSVEMKVGAQGWGLYKPYSEDEQARTVEVDGVKIKEWYYEYKG